MDIAITKQEQESIGLLTPNEQKLTEALINAVVQLKSCNAEFAESTGYDTPEITEAIRMAKRALISMENERIKRGNSQKAFNLQAETKFCFVIPEIQRDEKGIIPSVVFKGKTGHFPMSSNENGNSPWYWGRTREEAQIVADHKNESMGLSKEDVDRMVRFSMFGTEGI